MGDGFYRSKDPTNSIKVLKEATKDKSNNGNNTNTHGIGLERLSTSLISYLEVVADVWETYAR